MRFCRFAAVDAKSINGRLSTLTIHLLIFCYSFQVQWLIISEQQLLAKIYT